MGIRRLDIGFTNIPERLDRFLMGMGFVQTRSEWIEDPEHPLSAEHYRWRDMERSGGSGIEIAYLSGFYGDEPLLALRPDCAAQATLTTYDSSSSDYDREKQDEFARTIRDHFHGVLVSFDRFGKCGEIIP